ncbi:metallophosphoesterase [Desulfopila sp. IMCC35008]|uniref:metallophosphoesterase family protein n=1 Tax=Desulfopila sp. IMCC35008 TaxID=2653858 RepID=UPI0013D1C12A|nr:YfcE family phosphodiesterase [Desulfopila sp. IMCC35008]
MPTKIGLISDVHATADPVREALAVFQSQRVNYVFCVGDTAGYGNELNQTVNLLNESGCTTIMGNHDLWCLANPNDGKADSVLTFFEKLPLWLLVTLEGKRVYLVHASPPQSLMDGITLLDKRAEILADRKKLWSEKLEGSEFDVLVVGHTHQVFAEQLDDVLVINPGSTKFNHSCAILNLPEMELQLFPLSNKKLTHVWNWGMECGDTWL